MSSNVRKMPSPQLDRLNLIWRHFPLYNQWLHIGVLSIYLRWRTLKSIKRDQPYYATLVGIILLKHVWQWFIKIWKGYHRYRIRRTETKKIQELLLTTIKGIFPVFLNFRKMRIIMRGRVDHTPPHPY